MAIFQILFSGCKQFAEADGEGSAKYQLQPENQVYHQDLTAKFFD